MRLWIVMFVVILLFITGGLFLERSILKTTDYLSHNMDQIQEYVRNSQWLEALELCDKIDETWSKQQRIWSPFIHNHDLDVVTGYLARLRCFLEGREWSHSLAESNMIKLQLVQIQQQEIITLSNIF